MKKFLLCLALFALAQANPIWENEFLSPEIPSNDEDWALVPDGDGAMHMVDLNHEIDAAPFFNANQVIFRLFTRRNPTSGQVLTLNNAGSVSNSQFRTGHPTRFIIHGWNNNGGSGVNVNIRDAYLRRGEFNVIVVDWGAGAQTINYAAARNNINIVGPRVAQMVDFLNTQGMGFGSVAVIGHSLGGHTAGIAGKRTSRGRLAAVVALDPALPLFSIDRPAERVAPGDANYVEVMHTNAGLLGFDLPIGLSDYYPNWGRTQPGCGTDIAGNCAHGRAWLFFGESINSGPGFVSRQCRNYNDILNQNCVSSGANRRMGGEPLTTAVRGVFWVPTNGNAPFARGNVV